MQELHNSQQKVDCLDYLLYQIQKKGAKLPVMETKEVTNFVRR